MGRTSPESEAESPQLAVSSTDLLAQGYELIEGFSEIFLTCCSEPVSYYYVVACYQEGDRLASDFVEIPDRVVETPVDVGKQLGGTGFCGTEIGLSGHGDEPDRVGVIRCDGINDGQLPSADASPFGPEDQVDRLLLGGEGELPSVSESEREV